MAIVVVPDALTSPRSCSVRFPSGRPRRPRDSPPPDTLRRVAGPLPIAATRWRSLATLALVVASALLGVSWSPRWHDAAIASMGFAWEPAVERVPASEVDGALAGVPWSPLPNEFANPSRPREPWEMSVYVGPLLWRMRAHWGPSPWNPGTSAPWWERMQGPFECQRPEAFADRHSADRRFWEYRCDRGIPPSPSVAAYRARWTLRQRAGLRPSQVPTSELPARPNASLPLWLKLLSLSQLLTAAGTAFVLRPPPATLAPTQGPYREGDAAEGPETRATRLHATRLRRERWRWAAVLVLSVASVTAIGVGWVAAVR